MESTYQQSPLDNPMMMMTKLAEDRKKADKFRRTGNFQ